MASLRTLIVAFAGAAAAWGPLPASAQEYQANVTEWMILPKYCWKQFNEKYTEPQFTITNCGGGMNHYCGALLDLQRAKRMKTNYERKGHLVVARRETLYTLSAMKRDGVSETCPIAKDVQATLNAIELQMKLHNIK